MQTWMSGNFLICLKGVQACIEAQEGRWNFYRDAAAEKGLISRLGENLQVFLELWQQMPIRKRASSSGEGRISCFSLGCGSKLGFPLELWLGPQGPARGASGKSKLHACCKLPLVIPLQSLPRPRSSSEVEAGTSGFLSSTDMDLRVPLEFPQWSQASSRVETCSPLFS